MEINQFGVGLQDSDKFADMSQQYSQVKALFALTKASFIAMLRSPSAVAFTIGFPLVFVLFFGFIGNSQQTLKIGIAATSDTQNPIFTALKKTSSVKLITDQSEADMEENLKKGRIAAILKIRVDPKKGEGSLPHYEIQLLTSGASADKLDLLKSVLSNIISRVNDEILPHRPSVASISATRMPGRIYREIDFILPGMLGFSLLSTGVFGTAFLFFGLRQTLVLKRFFATPVKKFNILLGEALARLIFQLLGALFLIVIGYFFFKFTIIHGFETLFELLLLSAFGLIVFMGFGFIISSIAKNESTIPAVANIIVLPQFLLAGTFFPISVFPHWLQVICKILPLTYLNDALRKISFEGVRLWQLPKEILVITVWGVVIYAFATRVFRWE